MNFDNFLSRKNKKILSVDFGKASIKIALLESGSSGFRLLAYAIRDIAFSEETKKDVGDFIQNFARTQGVLEKEISLTFSDPDSFFVKILTLPSMPKEELASAIQWQTKTEVPFVNEASAFEYYVIREYADEEGSKKIDVLSVFAKTSALNKYIAFIRQCGFIPVKISSSPFDYAALLHLTKSEASIVVVLDVGSEYSYVSLYRDGTLVYVRKLGFSSLKLAQSLVGTVVTQAGKLEISQEQAQKILRMSGIPLDENLADASRPHVLSMMRPVLENLVKELGRSFDYATSSLGLSSPGFIYVAGGGSKLKNLSVYLSQEMHIPVRQFSIVDLFEAKDVPQDKLLEDQNQIAGVLGAALPSAFNLLPMELRFHQAESVQKLSLKIAAGVLVVFFLLSSVILNFRIHRLSRRIELASVQLQKSEKIRTLKQGIDLKTGLKLKIQEHAVPVFGLLKLLGILVPDNVLLEEVDFAQKDNSLLLKGVVTVAGDSAESVLVDFLHRLEASKFIAQATLVTTKQEFGINRFEFKCDMAQGVAKQ